MKPSVTIMWFRRDLRLADNAALYHALTAGKPVVPVFIFDRKILDQLDDKADKRVAFIHAALGEMQAALEKLGSTLEVYHGYPEQVYQQLLQKYTIADVFTNHDYEPYAQERDAVIGELLHAKNAGFHTYKDQVIFEKSEVTKDDGKPYIL